VNRGVKKKKRKKRKKTALATFSFFYLAIKQDGVDGNTSTRSLCGLHFAILTLYEH
jgi:hypothetical protein